MTELYGEDLAFIHHTAFGDFARQATPGLLALLREAGIRDGLVVDLACGSGIWARELIGAGYKVIGVEQSAPMLALARSIAPDATFVHASIHDVVIPGCRAVTVIGEGVAYDDGSHPGLEPFFARVVDALEPGGLLLFDLIVCGRGAPMSYDRRSEGGDWTLRVEVRERPDERRLTRTIEIARGTGAERRSSRETHTVRTFERNEVEAALRKAGFSVRASRRYDSFELPPRRLAFRARKRTA